MEGLLTEHPAAELIREIADAKLTGALRLSRDRAEAVLYFEKGLMTFAASNLRAHRLSAVLQRHGVLTEEQIAKIPDASSDEKLGNLIERDNLLDFIGLEKVREQQVAEVLRVALLWPDGDWKFEPRVGLANKVRMTIDVNRLLLECARHLPDATIAARFNGTSAAFERNPNNSLNENLSPAESLLLSKMEAGTGLSKLIELSGAERVETLRTIYGLWLASALQCREWPRALVPAAKIEPKPARKSEKSADEIAASNEITAPELEAFFARLGAAADHYEVLNVGSLASTEEIKTAYHALARRFHPDRFHRSEPELRTRIDSAFARIAHAYENLSDEALRAAYDKKRQRKSRAAAPETPVAESPAQQSSSASDVQRAETSFQNGMSLLKQNRLEEATRFLAEAATLGSRNARYRAQYGHALISQRNTKRIAEVELQAAISLEPDNTSYRVMLAELYKTIGLRQRAEGELRRALDSDPNNEAARALLSTLKK